MTCDCASTFEVVVGRPDEYRRAKRLLDRGRHPTFIGRVMVERCARNGGLLFVRHRDADVGVAVVNPRLSSMIVLCIVPEHRGHGLGRAVVLYASTNWARVVDAAVTFFEACGYVRVGAPKVGRRLTTHVMVRKSLLSLAGRLVARRS